MTEVEPSSTYPESDQLPPLNPAEAKEGEYVNRPEVNADYNMGPADKAARDEMETSLDRSATAVVLLKVLSDTDEERRGFAIKAAIEAGQSQGVLPQSPEACGLIVTQINYVLTHKGTPGDQSSHADALVAFAEDVLEHYAQENAEPLTEQQLDQHFAELNQTDTPEVEIDDDDAEEIVVERLREAGYSDEQINEFIAQQKGEPDAHSVEGVDTGVAHSVGSPDSSDLSGQAQQTASATANQAHTSTMSPIGQASHENPFPAMGTDRPAINIKPAARKWNQPIQPSGLNKKELAKAA